MPDMKIATIDDQTIYDLLRIAVEHNPDSDVEMLQRAYDFASVAHGGQKRKSGQPYIVHPLATAITLAELGLDDDTIAAGLMHDVPEDTETHLMISRKSLEKKSRSL